MFVPISVKVNGSTEYSRGFDVIGAKLRAFQESAGDLTEPLTAIGNTLMTSIAATMSSEGAGAWPPLSPDYGAWKAARSNAQMLVGLRPLHKGTREHPTRPETYAVSGRMKTELLAKEEALNVEPKRMIYAPISDIAGFHETGTSKMPARPPVMLTPATLHSWDREFVSYFNALIERSEL